MTSWGSAASPGVALPAEDPAATAARPECAPIPLVLFVVLNVGTPARRGLCFAGVSVGPV